MNFKSTAHGLGLFSIAAAAAITALDGMTARGLDKTAGKPLPMRA